MKDNQKLNKDVELAKSGNTEAKWRVVSKFLPNVYKISNRHWRKFKRQETFEERCLRVIEISIEKFDSSKSENFYSMTMSNIYKTFWDLTNYKRRPAFKEFLDNTYLETDLDKRDEDDLSFEFYTDLENGVERDVLADIGVKEKITFLAEGDSKKEFILRLWADGLHEDSSIANKLAGRFGGKKESHRKAVQRFRKTCKEKLGYGSYSAS